METHRAHVLAVEVCQRRSGVFQRRKHAAVQLDTALQIQVAALSQLAK